MVARLTPDQKVASSILVRPTELLFFCFCLVMFWSLIVFSPAPRSVPSLILVIFICSVPSFPVPRVWVARAVDFSVFWSIRRRRSDLPRIYREPGAEQRGLNLHRSLQNSEGLSMSMFGGCQARAARRRRGGPTFPLPTTSALQRAFEARCCARRSPPGASSPLRGRPRPIDAPSLPTCRVSTARNSTRNSARPWRQYSIQDDSAAQSTSELATF